MLETQVAGPYLLPPSYVITRQLVWKHGTSGTEAISRIWDAGIASSGLSCCVTVSAQVIISVKLHYEVAYC